METLNESRNGFEAMDNSKIKRDHLWKWGLYMSPMAQENRAVNIIKTLKQLQLASNMTPSNFL